MSNLKQKSFTSLTGASSTPTLTLSDIGEVIINTSNDSEVYLPIQENGIWFRLLNVTENNITVMSATPTMETVVELTAHEDKLLMSNGSTWYVFSSNYFKNGIFGDYKNGNYSEFEDTGFLINYGTGGSYTDIPPNPIIRSKTGGTGIPTLTTFVGNIEQYTFDIDDYIYDDFEFLHNYEEGTDFELHVHFATNGVDSTDRYVKFEYEYSKANRASTPTFEQFDSSTIISNEIMIPANTPDRSHFSVRIGLESGAGITIGTVLTYRFRRISASGTSPTSDPFVLQAGCHIKQNSLGSRAMYSKT